MKSKRCNSRGGHFQLKFDGSKLEPVSLNVSHAETIPALPEAFSTVFPHILDGVALNEQFPQQLRSTWFGNKFYYLLSPGKGLGDTLENACPVQKRS